MHYFRSFFNKKKTALNPRVRGMSEIIQKGAFQKF